MLEQRLLSALLNEMHVRDAGWNYGRRKLLPMVGYLDEDTEIQMF